jgi:hypothetical protein
MAIGIEFGACSRFGTIRATAGICTMQVGRWWESIAIRTTQQSARRWGSYVRVLSDKSAERGMTVVLY